MLAQDKSEFAVANEDAVLGTPTITGRSPVGAMEPNHGNWSPASNPTDHGC